MGFGFSTATRAKSAQLAVVADLPQADAAAATKAIADGADGLLVGSVGGDGALKEVLAAAGSVPVGLRVSSASREQLETWYKDGVDFFVLEGLEASAGLLRVDGPARLLTLDMGWPDQVWRTLEALPLDGGAWTLPAGDDLSLATLMNVARAAAASKRMLLLSVSAVDEDTLTSLRDIGVISIVVAADRVAAAKQTATDMPARKRRDRERMEAMLPHSPRAAEPAGHDHDDDDDD